MWCTIHNRRILFIFSGSIWARDKPDTNFRILISRAFTSNQLNTWHKTKHDLSHLFDLLENFLLLRNFEKKIHQISSFRHLLWFIDKTFLIFWSAITYILFRPERSFQFSKPLQCAAIQFLLKMYLNESILWWPFFKLILKCLLMNQSKYLNEDIWWKKISKIFISKHFFY